MNCVDCQHYRFLVNEKNETYGFCSKTQKETFPFDTCVINKKFIEEQRITKIYLENYKTKSMDEIVKLIGKKNYDRSKLTYFIVKKALPRRLWGD